MAVDYYHHIVIAGPRRSVEDFVHRAALVVSRRVAGKVTHTTVPFSFESAYKIAGIKDEVPHDPYDMTRWPIVRRGPRTSEVRYRFHTRSLEIEPLLKRLSRAMPNLKFALVTHCLDDGDFAAFTFEKGRQRGKWMGDDWRTPFWQKAADIRRLALDDAYDDDESEVLAESMMLDEAVKVATGSTRKYEWGGGRIYRDLFDERESFIHDLAASMREMEQEEERSAAKRSGRKKR